MAIRKLDLSAYEIPAHAQNSEGTPQVIHMVSDSHGRIKEGRWDGATAMCGERAPAESSGNMWVSSYRHATCVACLRAYIADGANGWFMSSDGMSKDWQDNVDRVLDSCRKAHFTNLIVRKDGQDVVSEGDWIKKLQRI